MGRRRLDRVLDSRWTRRQAGPLSRAEIVWLRSTEKRACQHQATKTSALDEGEARPGLGDVLWARRASAGFALLGSADPARALGIAGGSDGPGLCSSFESVDRKGVPLPDVHPSRPPGATASHVARLSVLAEREASSTQVPDGEGVKLRRTADGKGDGVIATRPFAAGETVMVGFLIGALTGNDSHATQVGPDRWALHTAASVQRATTPATPTAAPVSTTGRPSTSLPASRSPLGRS